jgi:hypothetical protein
MVSQNSSLPSFYAFFSYALVLIICETYHQPLCASFSDISSKHCRIEIKKSERKFQPFFIFRCLFTKMNELFNRLLRTFSYIKTTLDAYDFFFFSFLSRLYYCCYAGFDSVLFPFFLFSSLHFVFII